MYAFQVTYLFFYFVDNYLNSDIKHDHYLDEHFKY